MQMIPLAVGHLRKYEPAILDATTMRILHEDAVRWMAWHDNMTAGIPKNFIGEWNQIFSADVASAKDAIDRIEAEMASRGLGLKRG